MYPQDFPWLAVTGVLGFLLTILIILFKEWLANNKKILTALQDLKLEYVRQNEQLKTLFNQNINIKSELHDLTKKVEEIDKRQVSCGSCVNFKHHEINGQ